MVSLVFSPAVPKLSLLGLAQELGNGVASEMEEPILAYGLWRTYIQTVLDCFSRYVWGPALHLEDARDCGPDPE